MIKVIDASVAMKWFLEEKKSEDSMAVLEDLGSAKSKYVVPELFYYEIFSVCVRKHPNPMLFVKLGMTWLMNLPLSRIALTKELCKTASEFVELGLTGYDASYAAIAKEYNGVWITCDKEAFEKLGKPSWVQLI